MWTKLEIAASTMQRATVDRTSAFGVRDILGFLPEFIHGFIV